MLTDNSTASDSGMGFFFYHLGKILFQNEREVLSSELKKEKKNLFISALEPTTQTVVICVLT